jgi:hypothetical protein
MWGTFLEMGTHFMAQHPRELGPLKMEDCVKVTD